MTYTVLYMTHVYVLLTRKKHIKIIYSVFLKNNNKVEISKK